jgi:metal-responsive CopG/Arc/MetJ family transcriptional regulator
MRKRVTFTLPEELIQDLKQVSEKSMIPQAKLVEKAILDLLDKYKK